MKGKEYLEKILDLLVEMSEYCINKDKPINEIKCSDCDLCWNFSLSSHGCFLVEIIYNSEFIDILENVCIANNINYKDRLNKLADIFVTECE